MKYLSVCSGIEAATVAWHPLGWRAAAFSEIEPYPSSLLAHHYPTVPNLGDMTKFKEWPDYAINVLVGGTPCQSFSVAGLRKGLADPRGNLMLTYLAIADKYRPEWLVWENVPGVLSSDGGRDFGAFLGGLAELGYGFAFRVLDAQYFGVPQRRRRVFVVANSRNWQRAAAVLFERHSLQGHSAPRRQTGQVVAGTITKCAFSGGASGRPEGAAGNHFVPVGWPAEVAPTLNAHFGSKMGLENQHIRGGAGLFVPAQQGGFSYGIDEQCNATEDGFGPILRGGQGGTRAAVAYTMDINKSDNMGSSQGVQVEHCNTLRTAKVPAVIRDMSVRRLTPMECERLQGFPDGYSAVPHNGKPAADGNRYKALGNSMAVPCMSWIGQRIQLVSEIQLEIAA